MKYESLQLRNLAFSYQADPQSADDFVFREFNCDLPMNQVVCFTGPTGAGKNTFLKILAGLENPHQGSYLVNGDDLFLQSEAHRFGFRRRMGYGFSQGGLLQNRSLKENLVLSLESMTELSDREIELRANEYLTLFDLREAQDQRPGLVSGGMRMATCLARALVHEPELLLLNHPTNGLNQSVQETLENLIRVHQREKGLKHIFLVSETETFCSNLNAISLSVQTHGLVA